MFRTLKTRLFGSRKEPRVSDQFRIYAIGDIHGRLDLLDALLQRVETDMAQHPPANVGYVFLGDYVDRGPMSSQVLSRLIDHAQTHPTVCLKGNHEAYLMRFLDDPYILTEWARLGALPTLTSYGLKPTLKPASDERAELSALLNERMPDAHKTLLMNLTSCFTSGDFFFVHAGVRPGIPLTEQKDEDLLYIREEFLFHEAAFEKFIVHGHTPVKDPDKRSNRINIDTGAYATGRLTCLCLDADVMRFV
jgi:serine/threonine protein phosphatase 1